MLPLKLKIAGLYSYIKEQIIDFTQLSNAGLFGIFGEIGSGKSSILDAICFALYEKTERLNVSGDNRYYNMLNLNCDAATVEFQFQAGKDNQLYEIYFRLNRATNNFEKVEKEFHLYYKIVEGEKITITSKEIQEAIGLSYENFRRTIIIPQGKFKDFIELKGTDRSKMMKELFNLHRFDLSANVKVLEGDTKESKAKIEGELVVYNEVNTDLISQLEVELVDITDQFNQLELDLNIHTTLVSQLEDLKVKYESLHLKRQELVSAEQQEVLDIQQENELVVYENLKANFLNLFAEIELISSDMKTLSETVDRLTFEHNQTLQLKSENNSQLDLLLPELNSLETKKEIVTDYENIIRIKNEEKTLQDQIKKKNDLIIELNTASASLEENNTTTSNISREISELESNLTPESTLESTKFWFKQLEEKESVCETYRRQKSSIEQTIKNIDEELSTFYNSNLKSEFDVLQTGFDSSQFDAIYAAVLSRNNNDLILLREELSHLQIQEQLVKFSENLQPGLPCDLCGSTHHPNPLLNDFSIQKIEDKKEQINKLDIAISQLNSLNIQMKTAFSNKDNHKQQLDTILENLKNSEIEKQQLQDTSPNVDFTFQDEQKFKDFYVVAKNKSELLKSKRNELELNSNENSRLLEKCTLIQNEINSCDLQLSRIEATIKVFLDGIKQVDVTAFTAHTLNELIDIKDELIATIHTIEQKYTELNASKQNLEIRLAEIGANLQLNTQNLTVLQQRFDEKETLLNNELTRFSYSKEEVKSIISVNIDVVSIREKINQNRNVLSGIKGAINLLESQIDGKVFDPEEFESKKHYLNGLSQRFRELTELKAQKEAKLIESKSALIRKEALEKEFNTLTLRLNNLKTLKSLFSSNGFVDFMSIRYLHNIIELANVRFQKMTRQQYKLVLYGNNNELYIEDFLNGGKKRSLKSLGGGHTFQACLALALALSENIQKMAAIDQQFFFLDEGFGTLDKNALQLVFETLKSLKNENRVVGLISHVEELQQEMDVFLKITPNTELGTIVTESWK